MLYHIWLTSCCKSLSALTLRVLVSFVNSKTFTNCSRVQHIEDVNQEWSTSSKATTRAETDHSWTYLFNG